MLLTLCNRTAKNLESHAQQIAAPGLREDSDESSEQPRFQIICKDGMAVFVCLEYLEVKRRFER